MTEYCFYRFLFTVTGNEHNFDKIKSNKLETVYDYSSVMHYGRQVLLSVSQKYLSSLDTPKHLGKRVVTSSGCDNCSSGMSLIAWVCVFLCGFRFAFSKKRQPPIIPIPDSNVSIGRAEKMNSNDTRRINRLYCSLFLSPLFLLLIHLKYNFEIFVTGYLDKQTKSCFLPYVSFFQNCTNKSLCYQT